MQRKNRLSLVYIFTILLFLYLPMACVVVYSFNTSKSTAIWGGFTLDWYAQMARDRGLLEGLSISLRVGLATSALSSAVGTFGAVAMDRRRGAFVKATQGLVYLPLIIPEIVLGVALMVLFAALGMQPGYLPLIIAHSAFCIPYVYILVHIRLQTLDPAIREAARDLGASRMVAFRTITLPLAAPAIASGALLAFAMSLDDVVISFFVSGPTTQTLPLQIFSMLRLGITPKVNALCTLILVATFMVVGIMLTVQNRVARKNEAPPEEIL